VAAFVEDTFTDVAGTDLSAHTGETGATWTEHPVGLAGGLVISDANRVRNSGTSTNLYYASGTPPSADYYVQAVIVQRSDVGRGGICARLDDTADTEVLFRHDASSDQWQLIEIVAASATTLDTAAATLVDEQEYTVRLEVEGTEARGYVDDVEVCAATLATVADAGAVGLRANNASTGSNTTGYHIDTLVAGPLSDLEEEVLATQRSMMGVGI
jgi:hypothetical protein